MNKEEDLVEQVNLLQVVGQSPAFCSSDERTTASDLAKPQSPQRETKKSWWLLASNLANFLGRNSSTESVVPQLRSFGLETIPFEQRIGS